MVQAEPEAAAITRCVASADEIWLSPVNYLETGIFLNERQAFTDTRALDDWLASLRVRVAEHLPLHEAALGAFRTYGKGRHPARLNLADCFAYALAKTLDVPLLYKGDDFAKTDIRSAL